MVLIEEERINEVFIFEQYFCYKIGSERTNLRTNHLDLLKK